MSGSHTSGPRAIAAAVATLAVALVAPPAAAGPVGSLPVRLHAPAERVVAALDLSTAFGPELEKRFGSGLTNVVAVYVSLVPEDGGLPELVAGRIVEVLYDVWDEAYSVTVRDARLQRPVRRAAPDFPTLRRLLGDLQPLDLGPLAQLPSGRFHLECRVEINPVSRELMQRTRELLAHPAASRPGGGSRSVLGAVASYLLREPDPGDDVVLLRSRSLERSEVPSP